MTQKYEKNREEFTMKKRTLLALAVAMSVTAVAAANPFSDVPAKHWAYDSVAKLAKAGVVEGYGDNSFRGDRTMTRYEMAQIIARAMANSEAADAALKAELDKLSVEFAKELKNLGVRVTALENQMDNVKFTGDLRLRYDHAEDGWVNGKRESVNSQKARLRLQADAKVNDNWNVVGRFVAVNDIRQNDDGTSNVEMDKMFAQGKYGDFGIRVGRLDILPAYGIMYDDYVDGLEVSWTNDKFYGALRYIGSFNTDAFAWSDETGTGANHRPELFDHSDAYMAEIAFLNLAKGLNVRAAYTHFDGKYLDGGIWEAGADYSFGNSGFKVTGAAADSTGDLSDGKGFSSTAWFAQLDYKGAKKDVVGSWGAFGGYRDFQDSAAATKLTTFNNTGKGWYVGASYTPAKNIVLKAWYEKMKPHFSDSELNNNKLSDKSRDYIRAQAEFFF